MEDRDFLLTLFLNSRKLAALVQEPHDRDSLQALRSDDRLLRLAYADWLEERGEFAAEYLRVEVELAATPDDDPRYRSLEFHLQSLRAKLDSHWLALAGYRYDLHVLALPTRLLHEAADWLVSDGTLTGPTARFRLAHPPSILVFGTPRDKAEKLVRGLQGIEARSRGPQAMKLKIVVAGGTSETGG